MERKRLLRRRLLRARRDQVLPILRRPARLDLHPHVLAVSRAQPIYGPNVSVISMLPPSGSSGRALATLM